MKPKTILIIILTLLLAIIVVQNTEVTEFQIFIWKVEMSRAILFPIIFCFGAIAGLIGGLIISKRN